MVPIIGFLGMEVESQAILRGFTRKRIPADNNAYVYSGTGNGQRHLFLK
jgi:hypothetical protein